MKFSPSIMLLLAAFSSVGFAQNCSEVAACCDAVVPSINPAGNVGVGCTQTGFDCGRVLKVFACCARIAPNTGVGIGCN
ncbi:hypothetical protein CPC08DRAFT_711050 [Agrocybe pediades]|nr:hypothetical protein CPC08DRAFT_711050 [Agrocybe pediades]